jgi:hypothetical protein
MKTLTNIVYRSLAVLSVGLLTACYGEDFADCPPVDTRTVTLHFNLGGNYADDAFTERVQTVNVGIYNAAGDSIGNRQVTADELSDFAGVQLQLAGGDYSFVCWGNIDADADDDGNITYNDNQTNSIPKGGLLGDIHPDITDAGDSDPLWLGDTRSVTIPETGDWQTSVPFSPQYWELETFLNGNMIEGGHVFVELINLPDGTNVKNFALIDEVTSSYELTETQTMGNKPYEFADFRTFRFNPYDNDITLVVATYADAHELYTARLQDIVPQGIDLTQDIILPLLITINDDDGDGIDVSVTVGVPDWMNENSGWEFQ